MTDEELDYIAIDEAIKHKDDALNNGYLNCNEQSFIEGYRFGYFNGYRDSQKIDFEQAWEALRRYSTYINPSHDKVECIISKSQFRKAMGMEE